MTPLSNHSEDVPDAEHLPPWMARYADKNGVFQFTSTEELRELLSLSEQQLARARRQVVDTNLLMSGLQRLLQTDAHSSPAAETYAALQQLFVFDHALFLLEDPENPAGELQYITGTTLEADGSYWPRTPVIERSLSGRVIATIPSAERGQRWEEFGQQVKVHPNQPALFLPLQARGRRGVIMLVRAMDAPGFDQRDIEVGYKFTLLASQALATAVANRVEEERADLSRLTGELREARDQLAYQVDHDELTGLANRSYFRDCATVAFADAAADEFVAVVFLDLDGFKRVNDRYGHQVGDELLRAVACRLESFDDAVDTVARISGDEFMLLIKPTPNRDIVFDTVRAIVDDVTRPFNLSGRHLMISVSVGIAIYPDHGADFEHLYRHSDIAMYHAKTEVRGAVVTYSPPLGAAVGARLDAEQDLRRAVAEKRFCAALQPKVSLPDLRITGFEILARQINIDGKVGNAATFIDLAGKIGLIDAINELVIDDVLQQLPHLDAIFGSEPTLSVNVSSHQFTDDDYMTGLLDKFVGTGYAHRLIVEVIEDAVVGLDRVRERILPLMSASPVQLSIDDFGTGYSSFARLLNVNADEIKIDRSFVSQVHTRPRSQVFLGALSRIGRELGAHIVAEGVETVEELNYLLADSQIDEGQGYLFSRPLIITDLMSQHADLKQHLVQLGENMTPPASVRF